MVRVLFLTVVWQRNLQLHVLYFLVFITIKQSQSFSADVGYVFKFWKDKTQSCVFFYVYAWNLMLKCEKLDVEMTESSGITCYR